jgi:hypothetical protein
MAKLVYGLNQSLDGYVEPSGIEAKPGALSSLYRACARPDGGSTPKPAEFIQTAMLTVTPSHRLRNIDEVTAKLTGFRLPSAHY